MSSLRRDLFERRLWPVVALLLAAIVAVPLLLPKGAPATGNPTPLPPHVVVTAPGGQATAGPGAVTVPVKVLVASIPRDPFASGMPKLTAKPAALAPSRPAAPSSTAGASSSTVATPAAMVSPTPATTSTTPTTSIPAATPSTTPASTTATPPASVPRTPSAPEATPAKVQSWTLYSVAVRFGKDANAPVRTDIARLTPLPSAQQPDVMFMGVMAGGRQVVFALAAGLQHQGPGLCRPDRTRCSAIVLKAGQTEHITAPTAGGGHQQLILRLVHVTSSITHSRTAALAAYDRHSAAGLCALDLADPVSYSQANGTISTVTAAACHGQPAAVPFRYVLTFP